MSQVGGIKLSHCSPHGIPSPPFLTDPEAEREARFIHIITLGTITQKFEAIRCLPTETLEDVLTFAMFAGFELLLKPILLHKYYNLVIWTYKTRM